MLFDIEIRHGFYNANGHRCPDIQAVPTPECAATMAGLGMIQRTGASGFGVYVLQSRLAALTAYLAAHTTAVQPGAGCWTSLSFQLVTTNPGFIGVTDVPIGTNPMDQAVFASNLETKAEGSEVIFANAADKPRLALVPVATNQVFVPATPGVTPVLTALSGAEVPAACVIGPSGVTFSLAGLPSGLYTVGFIAADGTMSTTPPTGYAGVTSFVAMPARPIAVGLVTLLLAQPAPGVGTASSFPIATPPAAATPVTLTLRFAPRRTIWSYYVVPRTPETKLMPDLAITGAQSTFTKSSATLPNGQQAVLFTAVDPLPLQQQSEVVFSLAGQRQGGSGSHDRISVARLATAAAAPVWPLKTAKGNIGSSEIYVYV